MKKQSSLQEILRNAKLISNKIKAFGGKPYVVGGAVRDKILGSTPKDYDIEVYGLDKDSLINALRNTQLEINEVGKSFGVYKVGYGEDAIDVSLPRKEIKVNQGHKGFEIVPDHTLDPTIAAKRRDFTFNSIMCDFDKLQTITSIDQAKELRSLGYLLDPYGGIEDIENRIVRHVNKKGFIEDPLRILRAAQFASRFNFNIDEETKKLIEDPFLQQEIQTLSKERIDEELIKLIKKGKNIKKGLEYLVRFNVLDSIVEDFKKIPKVQIEKNLRRIPVAENYFRNSRFKLELILATFLMGIPPNILKLILNGILIRKDQINRITAIQMNYSFLDNALEKYSRDNDDVNLLKIVKKIHITLEGKFQLDFNVLNLFSKIFQNNIIKKYEYKLDRFVDKIESSNLEPFLNGKMLQDIGVTPGKKMGEILVEVYDKQLEDVIKTKEEALEYAKTLI